MISRQERNSGGRGQNNVNITVARFSAPPLLLLRPAPSGLFESSDQVNARQEINWCTNTKGQLEFESEACLVTRRDCCCCNGLAASSFCIRNSTANKQFCSCAQNEKIKSFLIREDNQVKRTKKKRNDCRKKLIAFANLPDHLQLKFKFLIFQLQLVSFVSQICVL